MSEHYICAANAAGVHSGTLLLSSFFFFSSRRRHTRCSRDWSSDVCSSDLAIATGSSENTSAVLMSPCFRRTQRPSFRDRKSTRLNSSHGYISYAVFCLKKKKKQKTT